MKKRLFELLLKLGTVLDKKLSEIDTRKKGLISKYSTLDEKITKQAERKDLKPAEMNSVYKMTIEIDEIGKNIENLTIGIITDLESVKMTALNTVTRGRSKAGKKVLPFLGKIATLGFGDRQIKWTWNLKSLNAKLAQVLRETKNVATILKTIELKISALQRTVK